MSPIKSYFITPLIALLIVGPCSTTEILQGINDAVGTTGESPLTQAEAGNGLKEALISGITKGADLTSKVDGFYGNAKIKIPFPPNAQKIADKLTDLGMGSMVDKTVKNINRGAEDAAKEAKPIFIDAIKAMTFKDALNILQGSDNAATNYLKKATSSKLRAKFKPVIQTSLNKVGATKHWGDVVGTYNKIPLVNKMNPDLNDFVTTKTMDGLFFMVAKEEKKIRIDPVARTTDLLKKVFGYYN